MSADAGSAPGRCAVIGSPVSRSLSPALHAAAYGALGLPWRYDAYDVTVEALSGFVSSLDATWRGLSVTMPLKRAAIAECDDVDHIADLVGAVNTLVLESGGERRGYNTDIPGFVAALRATGVQTLRDVVVVGAGATAASALAAAAELGAPTAVVVARAPDRAAYLTEIGDLLGVEVTVCGLDSVAEIAPADLVIATIPSSGQAPYAADLVVIGSVVFDVNYAPWETPLLTAARGAGRQSIGGFELLLHQAARQVELMTGASAAPLASMRAAGLAAVGH